MNSEELELSLRTEFESYLKNFRAEMRDHAAELHRQIEAEMEKHRSLLNQAFEAYAARLDGEHGLDEGFKASVVEHLRQARDEGATLTASAMDQAAAMDQAVSAPADFSGLRDAIADISKQRSQATILKSLVEQAAKFAPRGAFFIIKNDHFEGWKTFGDDNAEAGVRGIRFPVSSDTILGTTLSSQSTTDGAYGSHAENATFLEPLNYGQPDRMHAIPLVARGRGVAVLYVDYGTGGTSVNAEALEALVGIAGLTVELVATAQTAKTENREMVAADFEKAGQAQAEEPQPEVSQPVEAEVVYEAEPVAQEEEERGTDFSFTESEPEVERFDAASPFVKPVETEVSPDEEEVTAFEPVADFQEGEVIYDSEPAPAQTSPFDSAADLEPATAGIGGVQVKTGVETAVEVSPANVGRSTRSSRTVDLPIEVTEAERRPHNDARRFARLLVSEIKLYNEQRVTEGRQSNDLYQRLREAIDRSREMYDKRVQPPVAEKFDYFHYELVSSLADGSPERLGPGYPGSSV